MVSLSSVAAPISAFKISLANSLNAFRYSSGSHLGTFIVLGFGRLISLAARSAFSALVRCFRPFPSSTLSLCLVPDMVHRPFQSIFGGEKISHQWVPAVLTHLVKTFLAGGTCHQGRTHARPHTHTPKATKVQRQFALCSSAVFRSWQRLHRLCRLPLLVNFAQSPRCGWIWSTTVAFTLRPSLLHSQQNGCWSSWAGRKSAVQMGRLYQLCHWADSLRCAFFGLWAEQYPSRVKVLHPGFLQGLSGLCAMGYHLLTKRKVPVPALPPFGEITGSGTECSGPL